MGKLNSNATRSLEKLNPIMECIPRAEMNPSGIRIDRIVDVYATGNEGKG